MSQSKPIRKSAILKTPARILIADALNDRGMAILQEGNLIAEAKTGLTEAQLCEIIGQYDGLIVRSATKVTPKIIQAGARLQVIGRAGVGVDNIDLAAATQAGIVVQNTPFGNITSAAEHAIALLFSLCRHIPLADREMKAGKWSKKGQTGVELTGKTLGILGMGKVGAIVARVGKALDMEVLVFDPYLTDRRAADFGVVKSELADLLKKADFISVHSPLTKETANLINKTNLATMKKSSRIINAARGGIINEPDLVEALKNGTIAAAALDTFEVEPLAADAPIRKLENVILTPHLGASTEEAQERVAEDIAKQFVEFFRDGVIRNAVNVSLTLDPKIAAYAELAGVLGTMAAQLAKGAVTNVNVGRFGKLAQVDSKELSLFVLRGMLKTTTSTPVTLVNAPSIAEQRGIILTELKSDAPANYSSLLSVTVTDGTVSHTVSGTCFDDTKMRITHIDGFDIEIQPAQHLLLLFYSDRPGQVGKYGKILGENKINIANLTVGRTGKGENACVALTLDDPVPDAVLKLIDEAINPEHMFAIELKP